MNPLHEGSSFLNYFGGGGSVGPDLCLCARVCVCARTHMHVLDAAACEGAKDERQVPVPPRCPTLGAVPFGVDRRGPG